MEVKHTASKPQKLITAIILIILVSSIANTFIIPNAKAAELTNQQKAISTLSNVVGLDISKYNVSATQCPNDLYSDTLPRENIRTILDTAGSKLDTLCTFINGSLEKIYVCANEGSPRLNTQSTSDITMAQSFLANYQTQSRNSFYGELNSILEKSDATQNSSTTIGNIKLNVTVLEKDTTFLWTYIANGIEAPDKIVALRYTNGFLNYFIDDWNLYKIGSTSINLSEEDAINIAMARAENYSPDSSESGTIGGIKFNVTNAMIIETLLAPAVYAGADKARSQDPLELYPMYNVWVSLDKFYPGNVYGFNVYVWADTKEVYYIHQRVSTIDPPAELMASATNSTQSSNNNNSTQSSNNQTATPEIVNSSLSIAILPVIATTVTILVMIPVLFSITKRRHHRVFLRLPKTHCLKVSGILLCFLMFSPLLIAMSATPVAANMRGASVWGAESIGAINSTTGESWRKSNSEVAWQQNTAQYIADLFAASGYISTNNQGSHNYGSSSEAILSEVGYLEQNDPQYAVVDFDHGVGTSPNNEFHYMFEDNIGTKLGAAYPGIDADENAVYDYTLYGDTTGKAFFAFINTCMSADYNNVNGAIGNNDNYPTYPNPNYSQGILPDGNARGMAFAWTHRIVADNATGSQMSSQGYSDADNGNNCYIGFDFGSAALDQTIANSDYPYYYWVYHFFYYALSCDYTIHTALDLASQDTFYNHINFDASPLYNTAGFKAIWPMFRDGQWRDSYYEGKNYSIPNCHMCVYGNSYITLYQPTVGVSLSGWDSNDNWVNDCVMVDGQVDGYTGSTLRLSTGWHTISVCGAPWYSSHYFIVGGTVYNVGQLTYYFSQDTTIQVRYIYYQYWNPLHIYMGIGVGGDGGGSTNCTGLLDLTYPHDVNITIQAIPDPGYELDYWLVTDEPNPIYDVNPLTVMVHECGVEAHFKLGFRTLTINPGGNGSTYPSDGTITYSKDTVVPVTAYCNSGYVIDYWLLNGTNVGSDETINVTMDSNYVLEPVFRNAVAYNLTLVCGADGALNQSVGVHSLLEGTHFSVAAAPNSGFWVYWRLDGAVFSYDQAVTVTVRQNQTLEACFVSESLDSVFGSSEIFGERSNLIVSIGDCISTVRGQVFTCSADGVALSMCAAVKCDGISSEFYVRYAIYRLSDFSLVGETDFATVDAQGVYSEPQWQTIYFSNPAPMLQQGVDYVLVVSGVNDIYGVYVASCYNENQTGIDQQCDFSQGFTYPAALDSPNPNCDQYSIYCTVRPLPT